jgi:phosphate starvation-inducible membrane PsiE
VTRYYDKSIIKGIRRVMMDSDPKKITQAERDLEHSVGPIGNFLVASFHHLALFTIGIGTIWSGGYAVFEMIQKGHISIEDLLLLFIYLEIGAMVGIYFKTNHMPVRFLIYLAITAVTRLIIDLVNVKHEANIEVMYLGGTILILALANLVVRYASYKYPSKVNIEED